MSNIIGDLSTANNTDSFATGENEPVINRLPIEMFEKCLSYLNREDLQAAAVVWPDIVVSASKHKEQSQINQLIDFICENLNNESNKKQVNNLIKLKSDVNIFGAINLLEVKSSLLGMREKILNELKELEEGDLNRLEEMCVDRPLPDFFDNIFCAAKILKSVDRVELSEPCVKLVRIGYVDMAVKLIEKMSASPDTVYVDSVRITDNISLDLISEGKHKEAFKIVTYLKGRFHQFHACFKICDRLAALGKTKEALELTQLEPIASNRLSALSMMCFSMLQVRKNDLNTELIQAYREERARSGVSFESSLETLLSSISSDHESKKIKQMLNDFFNYLEIEIPMV